MAKVLLTPEAQTEFNRLPKALKPRVLNIFLRLEAWPSVSGVKWLKHEWTGHARIRVGDWRVLFTFEAPDVIVVRIKHRGEVYEDRGGTMTAIPLTIHGEEFVVIPKADYDRLRGIPDGSVDAVEFARVSIAMDLKEMREAAGLTQVELAKKMKRSQAFVSGAENGTSRVGERYVLAVLNACGLPEDWKGQG